MKSKTVFPSNDSLLKMLYLAIMDITKKWTGHRQDWGQIHSQLEIYFEERLKQKTDYAIGKYGIMRGEYMMKYQRHEYQKMPMDGTWNQYLHDVDGECHRQGSGIGDKADYEERGCDGAVKEREFDEMGAEGKWDKGEGGGRDIQIIKWGVESRKNNV